MNLCRVSIFGAGAAFSKRACFLSAQYLLAVE